MTSLYELKEKMATLAEAIKQDAEFIREKAADPAYPEKDLNEKVAHRDELQKRFDLLKKEHDDEEAAQRASLRVKEATGDHTDALVTTKAAFYRRAMLGGDISKAYEALGGIPANDADLGYGDKLLPKNLSNELITEPIYENPLRAVARITNITGFEEPRVTFDFGANDADLDDVTDKESANEIEIYGDTITYGRHKMKIAAKVSETVFHGTDTNLVNEIESQLRAGLAMRESKFAFLPSNSADSDHIHMSFYKKTSTAYDIKAVTGATMYEAIINALGDFNDVFADTAKIMMRRSDYYGMVKELSNSAETLFGMEKPSIISHEVIFNEKATIPVIGDFRFYGMNYDIGSTFDVAKDVDTGIYKFVFTAWHDQQIRLHSAFRLAIVDPS